MKTKNLFLILSMMLSLAISNRTPDDLSRRLCLLSGQYYHPGSDTCSDPFNEERCDRGYSWLLPTSVPGEVHCQDITDDLLNCAIPGISDDGEPYCIKETETAFNNTEEQIVYRQVDCPENMILMPDNWMRDTKPCPRNFTCTTNYKTPYKFICEDYDEGKTDLARKEKAYVFNSLVCSEPEALPHRVCVPNSGSMTDNSILQDSFKLSQLTCQENPCPRGKWPWLTEDGFQKCLDADTEEIQNCPRDHFVVEEEDGILKCQVIQAFFTLNNSNRCPKGRIWRRGRCQSRFLG